MTRRLIACRQGLRLVLAAALGLGLVACASGPVERPAPEGPAAPPPAAEPSPKPLSPAPAEAPAATAAPSPVPAAATRFEDGRAFFARLSAGLGPQACDLGPRAEHWTRRYTASPRRFEAQLQDALPLMAFVLEQAEARGLPAEVVLIPMIESGYRPSVRGPGGPAGLWQLMPGTARHLGLEVSRHVDGRFDPIASTDAALRHFEALQRGFGDWRLAVMAYNAGEGRIRRLLRPRGAAGTAGIDERPRGLPKTTQAYLDKLEALACVFAEPERYSVALPLAAFSPFTGAPPGTAGTHQSASAEKSHVVRAGDSLWRIARRHGSSVAALAAANGLRVDAPLRVGMRLRLPD